MNDAIMLEQLFGSKTRVRLLHIFLSNPDKQFFVRELTRKLHQPINSIRNELKNLELVGLLVSDTQNNKRFYHVDCSFPLYPELKNLLLKSFLLVNKKFVRQLKDIGNISYLTLTGFFTGAKNVKTDILIVGNVSRNKLSKLVNKMQNEFAHQIRYTVMSKKEFNYRNDLTDKFLYEILEQRRIVLVDKIQKDI
jgi:predicted transcriptional regulator